MNTLLITLLFALPIDSTWIDSASTQRVHQISADTVVQPQRNYWKPLAEGLAINTAVWAWDHYLYDRIWARIDIHSVRQNLKSEWVFDTDSYSGNQFSHPFHGSMFYNAARYHGHDFYVSALYPLAGSLAWEVFCETNRPAINDFCSTGIGGSAIGEATHRASDLLFDNTKRGFRRVVREFFGSVLNPARGLHRLISGDMWHVSHSKEKLVAPEPFSFQIAAGDRFMHEMRHGHHEKHVPFIELDLNYGDRFASKPHQKPYDWFRVHALLNVGGNEPTFSDLDIRGRIVGRQHESETGWESDFGLYQTFRYIDNYGHYKGLNSQYAGDFMLVNEAMSFGGGWAVQKKSAHHAFSTDLLANVVGLGGVTADYYQPRRYSFASGFSFRNDTKLTLSRRIVVGNDFYFVRLFTFRGCDDPNLYRRSDWGDKGAASVFINRAYFSAALGSGLHFNLEHILNYRHTHYRYYPDHHAKSYEIKAALAYDI